MKFVQLKDTAFDEIQFGAGILVKNFDPETGEILPENIIGATTGGFKFSDTVTYLDYGDDIDNCPKNMMELKRVDQHEVKAGGTYVTVTPTLVKSLIGPADVAGNEITPRNDIKLTDFEDISWAGDYSSKNGPTNGGYMAIKMMNVLSTGGFQVQTGDKAKGQFAFEYTAHYSIAAQEVVPYKVYVKVGTDEGAD